MNIHEKLKSIVQHYNVTRGCGHSYATLYGALDTNAFVICHNHRAATEFTNKNSDVKALSLDNMEYLRGHASPIVFDNATIILLLNECIEKFKNDESKINELSEKSIDALNVPQLIVDKENDMVLTWNKYLRTYCKTSITALKNYNAVIENQVENFKIY